MRNRTTVIPNLVIAQRVVEKMMRAASQFMEDETGEAMIGLVDEGTNTNGVPTIYVLDTISPDANAPDVGAIRASYTFQQGDESQYELFTWLIDNWALQREIYKKSTKPEDHKWDEPLRHIGDWHKQPGYMIAPSGGDLHSAMSQLRDEENQLEFLLAPIVTIGHPPTIESGNGVNYITVPMNDMTAMRVDFWYIHRQNRSFFPITPVVYPDSQLPKLVDYPWHLVKTDRLRAEQNQLYGEGLFFSILLHAEDGKMPMKICFLMARQNMSKMYIVVTDVNYPKSKPSMRVGPAMTLPEGGDIYDLFEELWSKSEAIKDPPGWKWTSDTYMIDYIHAIEDMLGLRPVNTTPIKPEADDVDEDTDEVPLVKAVSSDDSDEKAPSDVIKIKVQVAKPDSKDEETDAPDEETS